MEIIEKKTYNLPYSRLTIIRYDGPMPKYNRQQWIDKIKSHIPDTLKYNEEKNKCIEVKPKPKKKKKKK